MINKSLLIPLDHAGGDAGKSLFCIKAIKNKTSPKDVYILCDSRSSLESFCGTHSLHPLAIEIRHQIRELAAQGGNVTLFWVKARVGIPGNERADELAKEAAIKSKTVPAYNQYR